MLTEIAIAIRDELIASPRVESAYISGTSDALNIQVTMNNMANESYDKIIDEHVYVACEKLLYAIHSSPYEHDHAIPKQDI